MERVDIWEYLVSVAGFLGLVTLSIAALTGLVYLAGTTVVRILDRLFLQSLIREHARRRQHR